MFLFILQEYLNSNHLTPLYCEIIKNLELIFINKNINVQFLNYKRSRKDLQMKHQK